MVVPPQNDMCVGALEGEATHASARIPSQLSCPALLAREMGANAAAQCACYIRVDLRQMQDVCCCSLHMPAHMARSPCIPAFQPLCIM